VVGSWQGRGRKTAWERHGMCELAFNAAWERHGMYELAFNLPFFLPNHILLFCVNSVRPFSENFKFWHTNLSIAFGVLLAVLFVCYTGAKVSRR
jgi:hypothetical protein